MKKKTKRQIVTKLADRSKSIDNTANAYDLNATGGFISDVRFKLS